MNVSSIIISKSEKIDKKLLQSLSFSNEIIIVVDSFIRQPIIKKKTKIYFHPLAGDFASQRNFALKQTKNNWVLFVDDDEYVSTELAREILALKNKTKKSGFYINRIDVCFHQPLLHGETGHTKIIRLANKNAGQFVRPVHEFWRLRGRIGELSAPLYHIKDTFISEFIGRMTQYSDIDSDILTQENKPFTYWRLLLNPKAKFIQNYFCRLGILDGLAGLFQAYLMSVQSLSVRVYQWTKRNSSKS